MIDFSISDNTPLHLSSLKRIVCDLNDTGAELRMPAKPYTTIDELSVKISDGSSIKPDAPGLPGSVLCDHAQD